MKTKIIILALLVTAGVVGNAFANPTSDNCYPFHPPVGGVPYNCSGQ